ncbi:16S rRNA (cytidine(1402)-2'-O)-methyltransferase [Desulfitobacterium sp.]|uniref:16S rRNA (cytidine(1402)-2'-O)-methyltransferase n=1 Tax=Desulfitobacterium sp. TaxID=49981 RepID=UPI002BB2F460|nr:16S rRNA (cytidine(1402)-2'-O)-methyltransferase [Desulfitobacterium sp.]HVJ50722.1 16S rRNA (cytidine(1402)-2'-O)-methyltransferase [Desulfitobacterium sp.]
MSTVEKGTLYVCATPIGNLGDITLRVLEVLREADLIAAEDTRHSRNLLKHFEITTPLTSYHQHNEKGKAQELVRRLKNGETIALISDAGMPGISDPGQEVIRLCLSEKVPVDVLPGPNAGLTALVLSGLPNAHFLFHGFLPSTQSARKRELEGYAKLPFTQIFYEAPHRLVDTLANLIEVWGDREAVVVRELTKLHQTVHRGRLVSLLAEFQATSPRGEICVLLAPYEEQPAQGGPEEWQREVEEGIKQGLQPKEAMKQVAKKYGISKRAVYQATLEGK